MQFNQAVIAIYLVLVVTKESQNNVHPKVRLKVSYR